MRASLRWQQHWRSCPEYPPQVWKKITGKGNATPEVYSYVVQQLLGLVERMPVDAAAAGGLAIYPGTR